MSRPQGSGRESGSTRLSIANWVQAGFAIIAADGMAALKIDRLCDRLGVTKGSFYWHFTDMAAYRAALVATWEQLRDDDRREFDDMADVAPRDRLRRMMTSLISPPHWTLERAMREWARSDAAIADRIRTADRRVLEAIRKAFRDYGFDADEADIRANAAFAAGVGFLHLSGRAPSPRVAAQAERFLDLMLGP